MITSRRSFLTGLGATLITAPAIVRAASLMPVKSMPSTVDLQALLNARLNVCYGIIHMNLANCIFGEQLYNPLELAAPVAFRANPKLL